MTARQTILVAGGDMLYVELMERFDRQSCLVTYCATQGQVLDRASQASLVIVNLDIAGGAEDLCRRLRGEPSCAKVPIVVVAPAGVPRYPDVDEQVSGGELDQLIEVIRRLLPARPKAVARAEDDSSFDVESHTGMWRWDEESETWPPPLPEPAGRDMAVFTREFAGYVNSLLEAFGFIGQLSPAEVGRLQERSQQVVDRIDEVLNLTQTAVNDALKLGRLDTMREMSTARNVVYEKMRQLRTALADHREGRTRAPSAAAPAAAAAAPRPRRGGSPSSDDFAAIEAQPVESEITRAARAREAERRARDKSAPLSRPRPARGSRRRRVTGSAKKTAKGGPVVFLAVIGTVLAAAIVALVLVAPKLSNAPASEAPTNKAPVMQSVVLQQTPDGVRVEAKAVDLEGDSVGFIIRWRVNGAAARAAGGPVLDPKAYKAGDTVQAEVTPTDTIANGAPMLSRPLTIGGAESDDQPSDDQPSDE